MKKIFTLLSIIILFVSLSFSTTRDVTLSPCSAAGNGSTNDTTAINSCIDALVSGDKLYSPSGKTFLVTGSSLHRIAVNNVEVDLSGSTLKATSGLIFQLGASQGTSSSTPFTVSTPELGTTISANFGAIGVSAGDYIFISQNPSGGSGNRGEVLKVLTATSSSATVTTALHQDYTTNNSAVVQKVLSPISGLNVHDIILNGNGTASNGLNVTNVVDSTIANITTVGVLGNSGPAGAGGVITPYQVYNDAFNNIDISGSKTFAFSVWRAGHISCSTINIHAMLSNGAIGSFGFGMDQAADSPGCDNISVDGTGTGGGRMFKLNSAVYNIFNNTHINRGEGNNYNGITVEFFSAHNTWNNLSVTNMFDTTGRHGAHGIYLYGNVNQGNFEGNNNFNTFNSVTLSNNDGYGVIISDHNDGVEFSSGSITGLISGNYIIWLRDLTVTNLYIHNMTLTGPAAYGITGSVTNACINNNAFSSVSNGINISGGGNIGTGNSGASIVGLLTGACGGGSSSPPTPPTPPVLSGTLSAKLSWTDTTLGLLTFTISRSLTSGSGYSSLASGLTSTSYVDTTVTYGITYYYIVTATNISGTSSNSNQVSVTALR